MTESNALHRLVRQVPARIAGAGVLTLALAAGFAGGRVTAAAPEQATAVAPAPPAPAARALPLPTPTPGAPASYSAIVDRVSPAVVTVTVQMKATAEQTSIPDLPELFRQFGEPFGQQFRAEPRTRPSGLGSGVIIRQDGYILTNNHVVEDADRIRVELNDGRSFVATVVGTDSASDLAVIKVQATGLPTLPYGDSDQVKVGDVVLAVGNPLGLVPFACSPAIHAWHQFK